MSGISGLSVKLRSKTNRSSAIDMIIGSSIDLIPQSKLPTKKVVLQRWQGHRMKEKKPSDKEVVDLLSREVIHIWNLARIPTRREDHVKDKVFKLISEIKRLLKHPDLHESDVGKEYMLSIEHCFDIGSSNMESDIVSRTNPMWKEDLEFYKNQLQVPQVGAMLGIDKLTTELEGRCKERRLSEEKRAELGRSREASTSQAVSSTPNGSEAISDVTPKGRRRVRNVACYVESEYVHYMQILFSIFVGKCVHRSIYLFAEVIEEYRCS